jgi:hypothetical protein
VKQLLRFSKSKLPTPSQLPKVEELKSLEILFFVLSSYLSESLVISAHKFLRRMQHEFKLVKDPNNGEKATLVVVVQHGEETQTYQLGGLHVSTSPTQLDLVVQGALLAFSYPLGAPATLAPFAASKTIPPSRVEMSQPKSLKQWYGIL